MSTTILTYSQKNWVYNQISVDPFKNVRTIAIIGLSDKPERYSYEVAFYLQQKGFRIIPINPNVSKILGEKSYPTLLDVPNEIEIDIVDIFRRPENVLQHMKEVLKKGIKTVWLQEGVSSSEAEEFAKLHRLDLVSNFCIMKAHKNILSN